MPVGTKMKNKHRVLFVCLGNICRSPMAECVFTHKVRERGLSEDYVIDSAGVAGYHIGELPDRRMREHAWQRGYRMESRARQVCADDFWEFDYILAMDDSNYENLFRLAPNRDYHVKIYRFREFLRQHKEWSHIPDPYYEGHEGFELVLDLLEDGCSTLIEQLKSGELK